MASFRSRRRGRRRPRGGAPTWASSMGRIEQQRIEPPCRRPPTCPRLIHAEIGGARRLSRVRLSRRGPGARPPTCIPGSRKLTRVICYRCASGAARARRNPAARSGIPACGRNAPREGAGADFDRVRQHARKPPLGHLAQDGLVVVGKSAPSRRGTCRCSWRIARLLRGDPREAKRVRSIARFHSAAGTGGRAPQGRSGRGRRPNGASRRRVPAQRATSICRREPATETSKRTVRWPSRVAALALRARNLDPRRQRITSPGERPNAYAGVEGVDGGAPARKSEPTRRRICK
jgi:hypothetical protein